MGEGIAGEERLIPFISSANIACGYHAGDESTMEQTIKACLLHGVSIGVHCSFPDKANFGRTEMKLSELEIYQLVFQQCTILEKVAKSLNANLSHVKPHGALYNMSARDEKIAKAIACAVKDFNPQLSLMGLSGSYSISEAQKIGLKTIHEVFADRMYQDDGSLTPRSQPNSLINNPEAVTNQVLQMVEKKNVTTTTGKIIPIIAETICVHGDGPHAFDFVTAIYHCINKKNIGIKAQ